MVRLFVRHRVADYGAWRPVYESIDAERAAAGVTGKAVYQAVGDPNDVTVTHDFESAEAAEAFVALPMLRETMQRAGVEGAPDMWIANAS